MSNEGTNEEKTVEEVAPNEKPTPQNISVQEILSSYPIDREKCRDVILVEMSANIQRIANSLEAITQGLVAANSHLAKSNDMKLSKLKVC
jgi:hypothetical protein